MLFLSSVTLTKLLNLRSFHSLSCKTGRQRQCHWTGRKGTLLTYAEHGTRTGARTAFSSPAAQQECPDARPLPLSPHCLREDVFGSCAQKQNYQVLNKHLRKIAPECSSHHIPPSVGSLPTPTSPPSVGLLPMPTSHLQWGRSPRPRPAKVPKTTAGREQSRPLLSQLPH